MATILIVDDDRALRRAIATALTDLGYEAAEAGDGEAALAWLSRHAADAVLLTCVCQEWTAWTCCGASGPSPARHPWPC